MRIAVLLVMPLHRPLAAPLEVEGDGWRTVRTLVEHANAMRRRAGLAPIAIDRALDVVVARQGLTLDAVPPHGMRVILVAATSLTTAGA
jgi:hypothetical protein